MDKSTIRTRWAAAAMAMFVTAAMTSGCGKKAEEPAPKTPPSKPEAAKTVKKKEPPKLGLPVADFAKARLIQTCAAKAGESEEDALTLAVQSLLGQQHVAPPEQVAKPKEAPKKAPKKAAKPGKSKAEEKPKAVDPADADGEGGATTPAGRPALSPSNDGLVAKYKKAVAVLPQRPDVAKPLAEQLEKCRWSPQLGIVSDELVERYVEAFVQISCLQIKMRDKNGQVDGLKHAQAATEVFKKYKFGAREFSVIGLALGSFPDVTAQVHTLRRKRCADPVELRRVAAESGQFLGSFKGGFSGTIAFTGKDGAVDGTITVTSGALKGKAWPAKGAVSDTRVYLYARDKNDWLRLEGKPAAKGVSKGKWEAEIGLKKLKGTWQWRRKAVKKPKNAAK